MLQNAALMDETKELDNSDRNEVSFNDKEIAQLNQILGLLKHIHNNLNNVKNMQ